MKQVFLDLGTHYGQGLNAFIESYKMDSSWVIHTFEPNPSTYDIFTSQHHSRTPWVITHLEAASTFDGFINMNIETPPGEGPTGMGSSIIPLNQWDPWGNKNHSAFNTTAKVRCIDFSEFIKKNFNKEDFIVIKMDIEGSEYATLEKMLDDGSMEYVNDIFIEWHSRCFSDPQAMLEKEKVLLERIAKCGVTIGVWH